MTFLFPPSLSLLPISDSRFVSLGSHSVICTFLYNVLFQFVSHREDKLIFLMRIFVSVICMSEGRNSSNSSAQNESMNVTGSFIGVDSL